MPERRWDNMDRHVSEPGQEQVDRLAGQDLNADGVVVNLVICGDSRFYDYAWLENELETWVEYNGWPDLVICGGASGIDALAERWASNQHIPMAVFAEAWGTPRPGVQDSGRPAAPPSLVKSLLSRATHVIAFPGPHSAWTYRTVEAARSKGLQVVVRPVPIDAQ